MIVYDIIWLVLSGNDSVAKHACILLCTVSLQPVNLWFFDVIY